MHDDHKPIEQAITIVIPAVEGEHAADSWQPFIKKQPAGSEVLASSLQWGQALAELLPRVTTPLVAIVAHGEYSPGDLQQLMTKMGEADIVVATRPVGERPHWLSNINSLARFVWRWLLGIESESALPWRGWKAWRQAMNRRLWFGLRIRDAESGLQLFRKSILDRIPIQSKSRFASVEILAKANFLGATMLEVNVGGAGKGVGNSDPQNGDAWLVFNRPKFTVN